MFLQAFLLFLNGVAIINNERFLEKCAPTLHNDYSQLPVGISVIPVLTFGDVLSQMAGATPRWDQAMVLGLTQGR